MARTSVGWQEAGMGVFWSLSSSRTYWNYRSEADWSWCEVTGQFQSANHPEASIHIGEFLGASRNYITFKYTRNFALANHLLVEKQHCMPPVTKSCMEETCVSMSVPGPFLLNTLTAYTETTATLVYTLCIQIIVISPRTLCLSSTGSYQTNFTSFCNPSLLLALSATLNNLFGPLVCTHVIPHSV